MSLLARLRGHRARSVGRAHVSPGASPRRPSTRVGSGRDVDKLIADAEALLNMASGGARRATAPPATPVSQQSIDEMAALGYVCDESGCVLVLPTESIDEAAGPTLGFFLEGSGWGVGVAPEAESVDYPALVTGLNWAVPMTHSELSDLVAVLEQLRVAVYSLAEQGQWLPAAAERPVSRARWQAQHIGVQATYAPSTSEEPAFTAELTFQSGKRSITAQWTSDAVAEAMAALERAGVVDAAPALAAAVAAA